MQAINVCRHLSCEDVWAMFGEGVHPHIQAMYQSKLRQRLTPASAAFWDTRLRYFRSGLYFHGGMVRMRGQLSLSVCMRECAHVSRTLCVRACARLCASVRVRLCVCALAWAGSFAARGQGEGC